MDILNVTKINRNGVREINILWLVFYRYAYYIYSYIIITEIISANSYFQNCFITVKNNFTYSKFLLSFFLSVQ